MIHSAFLEKKFHPSTGGCHFVGKKFKKANVERAQPFSRQSAHEFPKLHFSPQILEHFKSCNAASVNCCDRCFKSCLRLEPIGNAFHNPIQILEPRFSYSPAFLKLTLYNVALVSFQLKLSSYKLLWRHCKEPNFPISTTLLCLNKIWKTNSFFYTMECNHYEWNIRNVVWSLSPNTVVRNSKIKVSF